MAENPSLPSTELAAPPAIMTVVQQAMDSLIKRPMEQLSMGLWMLVDLLLISLLSIPLSIPLLLAFRSKEEGMILGAFAIMFLGISLGALVLTVATMGGTLLAIQDDLDSGTGLGFGAVRERLGAGAALAVPATLLNQFAVLIGSLLCYIPGLVAFAILVPLMPIMADRKVGTFEAAGICWSHFRARPGWMVMLAFIDFILTFIVSMIPLVGLLLLVPVRMTLGVHAWRAIRNLPI